MISDRDRQEDDGGEIQALLDRAELLGEARVENDDELEAEERLDAGKDHAALPEEVEGGLRQRHLFSLAGSLASSAISLFLEPVDIAAIRSAGR